ncbi:glycosyltransferase family 2 protein [Anaerosporobacter sp.]|uniref:glycosyltransferase family 2 protein n=1 Tax=Anaerosporobacter sp. TaxID=1872529 RepID=UPI00286F2AD5|nr:glycosyltransferase family 2 protein [Anaerosporobacter sp.]
MKLLSVAIPSYNSEEYLGRAVETLLTGGEELEIIIVNDGSKDGTGKLADDYQEKHPTIIKAVHQENGGHGQAVNTGLKNATGLYFKVVDSDDWVNEKSLKKVLNLLRKMRDEKTELDLLIANYVYEKVELNKQKAINYRGAMPKDCIFGWDDLKHFRQSQNILMHSVFYRTQLLRDCKLQLPKHTFYVDNLFVYQPLPYVKTMYYLDENFYRYYIGREDQSVNEQVIMKRIDQQIRVTKLMIESTDVFAVESKKLRNYMLKYATIMMMVCSVYLVKIGTEESLNEKKKLWNYLKVTNPRMYQKIRNSVLGHSMHLPGHVGRVIIKMGYRISQKIFGFG